jgi:restriction endonuclease
MATPDNTIDNINSLNLDNPDNLDISEEDEEELTPEQEEFITNLKTLQRQLKEIDKQRETHVRNIRDMIRNHVKTSDDAWDYLPEYLKLTTNFYYYQYEVIDGQKVIELMTDRATNAEAYEMQVIAKELCEPYFNVNIDRDDYGHYIVYYSKK